MKFKHIKYPNCLVTTAKGKQIIFRNGLAETSDKEVQEVLKNNKDVEVLEAEKEE